MLLSRSASWFGLQKKVGLLIGLVLTAEVMLLPFALRDNLVVLWLSITGLTTILPPLWLSKLSRTLENQAVREHSPESERLMEPMKRAGIPAKAEMPEVLELKDLEKPVEHPVEHVKFENITETFKPVAISKSVEVVTIAANIEADLSSPFEEAEAAKETVETDETDVLEEEGKTEETNVHREEIKIEATDVDVEVEIEIEEKDALEETVKTEMTVGSASIGEPEITLEDLINCGFAAKNAGRFQSAAEWFTRALSLRPDPDLASYLIIDACSLWLSVNRREHAQTLIMNYWPIYAPLFEPKQQSQMMVWLSKENLLV